MRPNSFKTVFIRFLDWRTLCIAVGALLVGLIFWSISVYRQIEQGDFLSRDTEKTLLPGGFDRARLEKATTFFGAKEARFTKLLSTPLQIAGPGIEAPSKAP